MSNNKSTSNVKIHSCVTFYLVFLGLFIVGVRKLYNQCFTYGEYAKKSD